MIKNIILDIGGVIVDKYNLNIDGCVFFDDAIKNVDASNEFGLKSYLFNDINDIEDVL